MIHLLVTISSVVFEVIMSPQWLVTVHSYLPLSLSATDEMTKVLSVASLMSVPFNLYWYMNMSAW